MLFSGNDITPTPRILFIFKSCLAFRGNCQVIPFLYSDIIAHVAPSYALDYFHDLPVHLLNSELSTK